MRIRLRAVVVSVAMLGAALIGGGSVASAQPYDGGGHQIKASSLPTCNSSAWFKARYRYDENPNHLATRYFSRPTYYSGGRHSMSCRLAYGDRGRPVAVLQQALNRCPPPATIAEDGIFGRLTKAQLIWAQKRAGIAADGIYGPQSRNYLEWPVASYQGGPKVDCLRLIDSVDY